MPSRPVLIDRYGLRILGATGVEIAWAQTKGFELTTQHLFVRHGVLGYVVPLAGVSEQDRRRLEGIVAAPIEGDRPSAGADTAASRGPMDGALVVRWTSTVRDSYELQRFYRRAVARSGPAAWLWIGVLGVGIGAADLALVPGADLGDALFVGTIFGVLVPLMLRPVLPRAGARQTVHGPCDVGVDDTGVVATTPTARWHAEWDAITVWGTSGTDLCLMTERATGLAIPWSAIADRRPFTDLLASRVGPPI